MNHPAILKRLEGANRIFDISYALMNGGFPKQVRKEAEAGLLDDPMDASTYAARVLKRRWPAAEPVIMTDPRAACRYAYEVLKRRWPAAEPVIMTSSADACDYAMQVVQGRWPEGEPSIMRSSYNIVRYAEHVIQGRWPEAEPTLFADKDRYLANLYRKQFNVANRRPPKLPTLRVYPSLTALLKRLVKRYEEEDEDGVEVWDGIIHRAGALRDAESGGTFFHVQHEGADYYAQSGDHVVNSYRCPEIPTALLDLSKHGDLLSEIYPDSDITDAVETALPTFFKTSGARAIVVHGQTGSDVWGSPIEVVLLDPPEIYR